MSIIIFRFYFLFTYVCIDIIMSDIILDTNLFVVLIQTPVVFNFHFLISLLLREETSCFLIKYVAINNYINRYNYHSTFYTYINLVMLLLYFYLLSTKVNLFNNLLLFKLFKSIFVVSIVSVLARKLSICFRIANVKF